MIITINSVLLDDERREYKVLSDIKSGGQGRVFLCERDTDKKIFALKTMLNVFPSTEEYYAFQNELRSAKEIENRNVVKYVYMHDGTTYDEYPPYIIMEYANQGTLREILDERRNSGNYFTNKELTQIFLQLSSGMAAINSVLVHRDIKPENILIKDNILKISDFGLAKYTEATTRSITFKGYGTKSYCAPEVWKNEKNTLKMDIYSMGIVFYELATLNYPYTVKEGNYEEAHLFGAVVNPIKYNSDLAPNLVSIINKMLQKPKSKRFSDWQEIIDALAVRNSLTTSDNKIFALAQAAVKMQNASDNARQKKQVEEDKKRKKWNDHVKNIMFYFNSEIIEKFKEYAEAYNSQYVSGEIVIDTKNFDLTLERNKILIKMPSFQTITVTLYVINPEQFTKIIGHKEVYGNKIPIARKISVPSCNGQKVLAWGLIEDNQKQGYNILLLENKLDEYGDWYILYNTNTGFNRNPRKEPFAFDEKELPREIGLINCTHIYSSVLERYNMDRFQELVARGQVPPL